MFFLSSWGTSSTHGHTAISLHDTRGRPHIHIVDYTQHEVGLTVRAVACLQYFPVTPRALISSENEVKVL